MTFVLKFLSRWQIQFSARSNGKTTKLFFFFLTTKLQLKLYNNYLLAAKKQFLLIESVCKNCWYEFLRQKNVEIFFSCKYSQRTASKSYLIVLLSMEEVCWGNISSYFNSEIRKRWIKRKTCFFIFSWQIKNKYFFFIKKRKWLFFFLRRTIFFCNSIYSEMLSY